MKTYQLFIVIFIGILLLAFSCEKYKSNGPSKSTITGFLEKGEDVALSKVQREKYIDSAYAEFSDNKNDSLTRYFFRRSAVDYYDLNLYSKSLKSSKRVFSLGHEVNDTLSMARASYFSGLAYYERAHTDSAFAAYRQAEKLYLTLDDPGTLGVIVLYKAYIYYNNDEYVLCESEAIKALRLLLESDNIIDTYKCYNLIATALDGQDNEEEAISYFKMAFEQLDKFKDQGFSDADVNYYKALCYNNMGGAYVKLKQYDKAISIYKEALAYAEIKSTNPLLYSRLLHSLAYARLKRGDKTEVLKLFYQSLKIKDSLKNRTGIVASYMSIGEYFLAQKDTANALSYFKHAYTDATAIHNSINIVNSLKFLADYDTKNSSFYSGKYIQVNDSLQKKARLTRNKFARIEYETDKLQDEKEALARKNSFIIGVSVIVLLFVAAIFIIYYLNSRNKELLLIQEQQKANEEIYQLMFEQQGKIDSAKAEEKTRIAMELHDGILNNIYAVRLNLEFSNRKTDDEAIQKRKEFIKELQSVESEIRAVSHDLSRNVIFDQNKNFQNILGFMVTSQKNNFGTEFEADIDQDIDWENMPNVYKVNIYRIVQEALQNVNKYSQAKQARVQVKKANEAVNVIITDNGIGFDTQSAAGGIGLKNLKKRSESLNGSLVIESQPGQGTTIRVAFAL